ncbi:MAG TPA: sensor of ECF-type sigma factor [Flavobacterium sp.]|jgi:predicted DNA-binding WGR domain protein
MKKALLILLIFCSANLFSQGQNQNKVDRIKSLKVAFITDELALTPEESAKFWPIYNEFETQQRQLKRSRIRSSTDGDSNLHKFSEKEAADRLKQIQRKEEELHQLRMNLVERLRKVIPPSKILKLKNAEENFNKKLLKQYRSRSPRR